MKNSTTFAIITVWFITLVLSAFSLENPEIFEAHHSVDGYGIHSQMSNLGGIILMTLPFVATGLSFLIGYIWYKEQQKELLSEH